MMAGEKKQKRIDQIDGRTVLFLTLCACIVTFLTTSFLGHGCFSFLIFLILCWFGLYKQALGCFAVYLVAIVWLMIETKYQISIPSPSCRSPGLSGPYPAVPLPGDTWTRRRRPPGGPVCRARYSHGWDWDCSSWKRSSFQKRLPVALAKKALYNHKHFIIV